MAYILLAIGALMSLAGVAAMATGYPMIEIERGWAMVITGAVLLSGGLVVVALGFVVRHLIGLRGALSAVGALPREAAAPVPQPEVAPMPLMPSTGAPAMPSLAPLPLRHPLAPALGAGPVLAAAVPAGAAVLAAGTLQAHEAPEPEPSQEPMPEPPIPEPPIPEPHAETPHVPETYVPEVNPAEPNETAHDVHEPTPDVPAEPVANADRPRTDADWLDQAFSAFDYEMTNGHPPPAAPASVHAADDTIVPAPAARPVPAAADATEAPANAPEVAEAQHEHALGEPDVGGHADAQPSEAAAHPPHDEAPATAPAEPAANLTVIGRYDSEGTSYVMYSDGSIEAHSEAGVCYRFGSMAELKAFIEG